MRRNPAWMAALATVGLVALAGGSAACADSEPPPGVAALPDTIATGELYILGNRIEPPYVFYAVRDSLYVNGILAYPYKDLMAIPVAVDSITILDRRLGQLGDAMSDSGRAAMEVTQAVASMLRARPDLFSKVEVLDATSIVRWYADNGQPETVQYGWGQRRPPMTLASKTANNLTYITYGLGRGAVVFVGVEGIRGFETTPKEEYPLWVLKQLESPGRLRRLREPGAGTSSQQ
jgi:hypothetical protein